jgi:hypothetical protein
MNKTYIALFATILVLISIVEPTGMGIALLALVTYTALLLWKKERMVSNKLFRSEVRRNLEEIKPLVMTSGLKPFSEAVEPSV